MMDEFENNRENEHVDQTPHAETPYDTGDGNTDNLKRTEQQTEQNAEHRQEDAYTQAQQYGSTYYGDMRTQEYMQAMAERAQQMSQGTEHYYNNNYQQPNQNAYNYGQNNYYQNGFQNADAEQPKAKVKKAKKQRVKKAKSPKTPHNKRTFWKKGVEVQLYLVVLQVVHSTESRETRSRSLMHLQTQRQRSLPQHRQRQPSL